MWKMWKTSKQKTKMLLWLTSTLQSEKVHFISNYTQFGQPNVIFWQYDFVLYVGSETENKIYWLETLQFKKKNSHVHVCVNPMLNLLFS